MLLKELSDEDVRVFLCVAELLSVVDKPILWNGKPRNEIAAKDIGSAKISLKRSEQQIAAMKELVLAVSVKEEEAFGGISFGVLESESARSRVEGQLIQRLESLPLDSIDDTVVRVNIARELLNLELRDKKAITPFVPKLMLFELMLFVLGDGEISVIQWNLLDEFGHHYQIDDYIVQDLLERAEVTHQEAQKTIAIILE
ncbi:hypothetical protein HR51_01655 [Burkholderia cepacia]|nr:hypothetical protein HR51_01655 [Burkholderia cepacia]